MASVEQQSCGGILLFQCRRRGVLYVADACSSVDVGGCSTLVSYGVRSRVSGASISEAYVEDGSEAYQLRVIGQVMCAQAVCACMPQSMSACGVPVSVHARVCVCVRAHAHTRKLPALTHATCEHYPHHVLDL